MITASSSNKTSYIDGLEATMRALEESDWSWDPNEHQLTDVEFAAMIEEKRGEKDDSK